MKADAELAKMPSIVLVKDAKRMSCHQAPAREALDELMAKIVSARPRIVRLIASQAEVRGDSLPGAAIDLLQVCR